MPMGKMVPGTISLLKIDAIDKSAMPHAAETGM